MSIDATLGSHVELIHGSRQTLDMRGEFALQQSFHLACLTSRYFGGGLVKIGDWMPGLTLRVNWAEGTWLSDLPSSAQVIQELNLVTQLIESRWLEIEHDLRAWHSGPRQKPIHWVDLPGEITVSWTHRVARIESPAVDFTAHWPGLPLMACQASS